MSLLSEFNNEASGDVGAENINDNHADNVHNEPTWWYDEHTPGVGDRPDFLPEKFKSLADAAKSFVELEKRLGGAPKEYDFSAAESWLDPDYEPIQEMAELARQKHIPQDVMNAMLTSVGKYLDEFKPDINEERAKLGDNASERLNVLNNWAKSNMSEKAYHALTSNLRTAEAIEALEEIRSLTMSNNTMIPTGVDSALNGGPSVEDVRSEMSMNFERYQKDEGYRREITKKLEQALKANQR